MPRANISIVSCFEELQQLSKESSAFKVATDLTEASRDRIKEKNFAIPDERRYPIHDMSHARSALSMVAAHGSPGEKAQVHAAIEKKYPGLAARSESIAKEAAALVKDKKKAWATSQTRSGKRSMSVDTLLRKEKDGTLGGYKFSSAMAALHKVAQSQSNVVPFIEDADNNRARAVTKPGDIPSRDDFEGIYPKRENTYGNTSTDYPLGTHMVDVAAVVNPTQKAAHSIKLGSRVLSPEEFQKEALNFAQVRSGIANVANKVSPSLNTPMGQVSKGIRTGAQNIVNKASTSNFAQGVAGAMAQNPMSNPMDLAFSGLGNSIANYGAKKGVLQPGGKMHSFVRDVVPNFVGALA